jgi:hypothetical protein
MNKMKLLEEIFDSTTGKKPLELTNVVPISGLIMARFYMIENELNTILDVWKHLEDPTDREPKETKEKTKTPPSNHSNPYAQLLRQNSFLNLPLLNVNRNSLFTLPTKTLSFYNSNSARGQSALDAWDLILWVF